MSKLRENLQKVKEALASKSSTNQEIKIINLDPIEDSIIQDLDSDGTETLRLGVMINGKKLTTRFPTLRKWDDYTRDVASLFILLAQSIEHLEIPDDHDKLLELANDNLGVWATLTSAVIRRKGIRKFITNIFLQYLQPHIDGVPIRKSWRLRKWFESNAPIDTVYRMFVAILSTDSWLKKKVKLNSEEGLPDITGPIVEKQLRESTGWTPERIQSTSILLIRLLLRRYSEYEHQKGEYLERERNKPRDAASKDVPKPKIAPHLLNRGKD